jgi:hypothetical protein
MSAFVANNLECTPDVSGYLGILSAELRIYSTDKPFNVVDSDSASLISTKRTLGAGIVATANTATSVPNQFNNLMLTFNAGAQTLEYQNLALNYSTDFFDYSDDGFIQFPLIFENIAINSALTLAQRTVRIAIRTTDATPIVYGAVGGVVGALTPTVTSPDYTVIIGDPTNTGTQDLRGATVKIKIPLELMFSNPVIANISATKTIDRVSMVFALPATSQAVYYRPQSYRNTEDHCPDGYRKLAFNELTDGTSMSFKSKFKDVTDFKEALVNKIGRQREDKITVECQDWNMESFRILSSVQSRTGGRGRGVEFNSVVPAGLSIINSAIDTSNGYTVTAHDIRVRMVNSSGCVRTLTTIESGNPLTGEVLFVRGATNNKLVFNASATGLAITVYVKTNNLNNLSFSLKDSIPVKVDIELTLGNAETEAGSDTIQNVFSTNKAYFADVDLSSIKAYQGGSTRPVMKIELMKSATGETNFAYSNCAK